MSAFLLSLASVRILETPVRNISIKKSKKKLAAVLASLLIPLFCVNAGWAYYVAGQDEQKYGLEEYLGAMSISNDVKPASGKKPVSSPLAVKEDLPALQLSGMF
ncbi:hypothetical protein V6B33_05495 [Mangrovibacillus sp. Mu-81]|uniref:hypothetical protein n=1 Tax=Mangrovibacillus sp. Mu-81 TaxID=3121478 RepID=UPI002FE495DF